jgi:hypothetical protein
MDLVFHGELIPVHLVNGLVLEPPEGTGQGIDQVEKGGLKEIFRGLLLQCVVLFLIDGPRKEILALGLLLLELLGNLFEDFIFLKTTDNRGDPLLPEAVGDREAKASLT